MYWIDKLTCETMSGSNSIGGLFRGANNVPLGNSEVFHLPTLAYGPKSLYPDVSESSTLSLVHRLPLGRMYGSMV